MPGITVGNNVVIGAGSVVNRNIPDNVVIAGVPAKVIKSIEDYRISSLRKSIQIIDGIEREKQILDFLKNDNEF